MKDKYIYPAIFEFSNDNIMVTFPDLTECIAFSDNQEEAFINAKRELESCIYSLEKSKKEIPSPSNINTISIKSNETIAFIEISLVEVKKEMRKPKTMTVKEFSQQYGIGISKCYEIVHAKGFPAVKFGKRIVIIRSEVDKWLVNNIGKQF